MKKHLLTKGSLKKLKNELHDLIEIQRPAIIKEIKEARGQGDLSENTDYDAAKAQQVIIETQIQNIQRILENYELINENEKNDKNICVQIGSRVKYLDHSDKKEYEFEIVGSIDASPINNRISNESPIAKSLIGKKTGDIIEVLGVNIPYTIQIKKIT